MENLVNEVVMENTRGIFSNYKLQLKTKTEQMLNSVAGGCDVDVTFPVQGEFETTMMARVAQGDYVSIEAAIVEAMGLRKDYVSRKIVEDAIEATA